MVKAANIARTDSNRRMKLAKGLQYAGENVTTNFKDNRRIY